MARLKRVIGIITCLAVVSTAMQAVIPTFAATVSALSDQMRSQAAGTASNHTLSFTTGTGAAEGTTIVLTFDASFDTASITEDDVDVLDDGVQRTTATSCGSAQASVAMASDVLTITICAGGGGAIGAGSVVTVRIGTNATNSGTGTNRITNPSSVGTYAVRLSGTFGDVGNIWIPIISSGSGGLPVSVSIGSAGGGGGGGPAPVIDPTLCGDTTPPSISSITAIPSSTSAAITWQTSENATSVVRYGLTASYGSTVTDTSLVQNHTTVLSGLTSGTVYQFQVESADICNNTTTSGNFSFTTTDTTAPVISNIEIDIAPTTAIIDWMTNETTTGYVVYGPTTSYGSTITSPFTDVEHEVFITGLTPSTTYHYEIRAQDIAGNEAFSGDRTFTTPADLPPSNVTGLAATPGDSLVNLSWTNPVISDFASVRVLFRTDRFPTSPTDGTQIYNSTGTSFAHTGLTNGTTYYYGVFVFDVGGQNSSGAVTSATPTVTAVVPVCGDAVCASEETSSSCPADCATVETEPVCGDATCNSGETTLSCPSDCVSVVETTTFCGDGTCNGDETTLTCSADCAAPVSGPVCGDAICSTDESAITCPADCSTTPSGACGDAVCSEGESISCPSDCAVAEPILPGAGGSITDVSFLVGNDLITLPSASGTVVLLPGRVLDVRVESSIDAEALLLVVGDAQYLLTRISDGSFQALVSAPSAVGTLTATIRTLESDIPLAQYIWQTKAFGFTFETLERERERIGARVTLFSDATGVFFPWEAASYGQLNPVTTPSDGTFAWYVPSGRYYVRAQADGYRPTQTAPSTVANSIATWEIELQRERTLEEVINSPAPPLQKLEAAAGVIFSAGREALDTARNAPSVQRGVDVASPLLLSTGAASTVVLATSFNLFPFLQYLFTSPILFLFRRRRKSWGVVYDALTKVPIDLSVVRLYRQSDGRLIQSRVTDKFGRYFFFAEPGQYRLGAAKVGYVFPSSMLTGLRADGGYLDLYHGEVVVVSDEHATIAANIPLDPSIKPVGSIWRIRLREFFRGAQHVVAVSGILVAIAVVALRPSVLSWGILVLQVVVYALARRLAKPKKAKGWGIVYDAATRSPLAHTLVRVFEPVYNKLLATAVTDREGRYNVLVGPSEYYARYQKEGYEEAEVRPIDFRGHEGPAEVKVDVPLKPKKLE